MESPAGERGTARREIRERRPEKRTIIGPYLARAGLPARTETPGKKGGPFAIKAETGPAGRAGSLVKA